ncbi:hypothetical protein [Micromonospora inaquosa]|uniref:Uncharacterized protein n=1 Tax=Micromonospora inaquosa TaxID=2203716 RepID=A0A3N9X162_9ACTN|nr:hypothetical protein [Micromonospora inaquosa]RQX06692.1 hypothetical protein DLJ59_04105 [Micromonospora inaquosa]
MPAPHQPIPSPEDPLSSAVARVDRTALGEIEAHARTGITRTVPGDVIDPDAPPLPLPLPMFDFRRRDSAARHRPPSTTPDPGGLFGISTLTPTAENY